MSLDDLPHLDLDYPGRQSSKPTLERCPVHGVVVQPGMRCEACRREDDALPMGLDLRKVLGVVGALGMVGVVGLTPAGDRARASLAEAVGVGGEAVLDAADVRTLGTGTTRLRCSLGNGPGRDGHIYVPQRSSEEQLGLVLAFHGTNGHGAGMVAQLRAYADTHRLVIVAPDAARVRGGTYTWSVGERPGEHTIHSDHIAACLEDAVELLGDALAPNGWFALGHSGGGSSAPFLATNDARFEAFAVLHGGVFEHGLGSHRPRGWFSTGARDSMRSPEQVEQHADRASAQLGDPVTFRVFPGGHRLSKLELDAVFAFFRPGR